MKRNLRLSIAVLLACAAPWFAAAQSTEPLTVYRCTSDSGAISLQDRPCGNHEAQQMREMVVPVDVPVASVAVTPLAVPPAQPAERTGEVAVAVVTPQPLYECRRPDGSIYESASGIPQRHWVPLAHRMPAEPGIARRIGRPRITGPQTVEGASAGVNPVLLASGSWVEETCYALAAAEACSRRREQLAQLGKDWYLAFPSERDQIERQQAGLRDQLRAECGDG